MPGVTTSSIPLSPNRPHSRAPAAVASWKLHFFGLPWLALGLRLATAQEKVVGYKTNVGDLVSTVGS